MSDPPKQGDSDAASEPSSAGPTEEDLEYEREERLGIQGLYDSVDLTFPPLEEESLDDPDDANR